MSAAAAKNVARFLEWDTQFFGVRIATIECAAISDAAWREQLGWCRAQRIQCLYVLIDAQDETSARDTGLLDARHLDERKSLERDTSPLPEARSCAAAIRPVRRDDVQALRALAVLAHKDTRFWKDGRFSPERCAELYATWIERSIEGWADAVFVAELRGEVLGYITCHAREEQQAEIGLIAVADAARGAGIGRALVQRALGWAAEHGLARTRVVTQGTNLAALSLYTSTGFRVTRTQRWYHLWFMQP
jgi:dTDP-4-amino-4,6-dideoxy-D-galactose acyltransferase